MELGLTGKVAIVAASSKGLGRACAEALAREGAKVVINGRRPEELARAAQEIRQVMAVSGAEVHTVAGDITQPEDVQRLFKAALARFGQLDILVTNGGGPSPGKFADLSEADWQAGLDTTLWPTLRLIRAAVPHLQAARERGGGRIINIVSTSVKQPIPGLFLSNALRPAVIGLAKSLSAELAPDGILVNNVCPGSFDTDRIKHVYEARAAGTSLTLEEVAAQAAESHSAGASRRPARTGPCRRLPRVRQSCLSHRADHLGRRWPGQFAVRLTSMSKYHHALPGLLLCLFCAAFCPATAAAPQTALNQQLLTAAGDGDPALVRYLLAQGASVNARDELGRTPLMNAVFSTNMNGNALPCVKILLQHKANVNACDKQGLTPLMFASDVHIMGTLLHHGAKIDAVDDEGETALMQDINGKANLSCVYFLLARGASPFATNKAGATVLMYTAGSRYSESLLPALLRRHLNVNARSRDGGTALISAAYSPNIPAMKMLLDHGALINARGKDGETALMAAAHEGTGEAVTFLVKRGADVNIQNKDGDAALKIVLSNEWVTLPEVQLLLDHGANVNLPRQRRRYGRWSKP